MCIQRCNLKVLLYFCKCFIYIVLFVWVTLRQIYSLTTKMFPRHIHANIQSAVFETNIYEAQRYEIVVRFLRSIVYDGGIFYYT